MVTYDKLTEIQTDYINSLMEFSESQVWFWQRIPRLAAMANGRSGYSDVYSYAYRSGFWKLRAYTNSGSGYPYRVDLATGVICSWKGYNKGEIHRAEPSPYMLSFPLSELHAEEIYNSLLIKAQEPFSSYYDREHIDQYHKELERMNITEVFTKRG